MKQVGVAAMELRQGTDAVGREEFALVQHELQNAAQLVLASDRQQSALTHSLCTHASKVRCEIGTVVNEPIKTFLEIGQLVENFRFQGLYRKQRDQSHHGSNLH